MAVDVYALLKQLIQGILTDRDTAAQYAEDPYGTLAVQGVADGDLSTVDVRQVVGDMSETSGLPHDTRQSLQNYCNGSPAPSHHQVQPPPAHTPQPHMDQVVQHLNYVTYVAYEGDDYITTQIVNQVDNSVNIDNSTNIDVDGVFQGDINVDNDNLNVLGDGAVVNTGDGTVTAATGDGAQAIGGDNTGQANTGAGAVQVGGDLEAPVNTGTNSGILADGDVQSIVGDNNQSVQVDGSVDDSVFNFGGGDVTNVSDVDVTDGAFATGGSATNVSDNTLDEGSALAVDGNASGTNTELDVDINQTNIAVDVNANVGDNYGNGDHADGGGYGNGGGYADATDLQPVSSDTPLQHESMSDSETPMGG